MKIYLCFILGGMILANANPCVDHSSLNNQCFEQGTLEQQFIQAISIIDSQTNLISKFRGFDAVFFVGETGCGKSTIFNWLMGKELKAVKDEKKSVPSWNVDVIKQDTNTPIIGHSSVSQTSIPTFGKTQNGMILVDFPGWGDNRGWQHDLVNYFLQSKTSENFSKIKIVFICEYQYIESKRGYGLKEMIQKINHFAQNTILDKSAMLVITKVTFEGINDQIWEEQKQKYIQDVRGEFQKVLDQSGNVSDQIKKIITSLIQNDIYIMRKAGQQKQKYTIEESQELKNYIEKLESFSLQLKPQMTQEIINQFNNYFTQEFNSRRERVKNALNRMKSASNVVKSTQGLNKHNIIMQFKRQIEQFQIALQQEQNQMNKYHKFEQFYTQTMQAANLKVDYAADYYNLQKIYNYFSNLSQHVAAYQLEIFDEEVLNGLKNYFDGKAELEKIHQVLLEERRRSGRELRKKVNDRRGWWKFWLPDKIPYRVADEDVEEFIRRGG